MKQATIGKLTLRLDFVTLAIAVLSLTGCARPAANTQGLAFDLARERALRLAPMMSQAEVQSFLGPPDQIGFRTLGGVPWAAGSMGQVWTYEWKEVETKTLVLFFGFAENKGWRLISWSWS